MCVPAALEVFRSLLSSPDSLSWIGMGFAAVAGRSPARRTVRPLKVSHVVDLTQILTPEFPSWPGYPSLEILNTHNIAQHGFFAIFRRDARSVSLAVAPCYSGLCE